MRVETVETFNLTDFYAIEILGCPSKSLSELLILFVQLKSVWGFDYVYFFTMITYLNDHHRISLHSLFQNFSLATD
jgi:hypothetical protein